ncbi:alpha/beta fold hydrolase [Georgenia alba]|uniref:Alpha/beta fold hydrolase n=1 Tax=Georgenia alba TaxID=2233858 RepID=A0ABW2Q7P4_9MICO
MTVVICHGAGGTAWEWHRVRAELESAGHRVVVIDMPCDDESKGLHDCADAVVAAATAAGTDGAGTDGSGTDGTGTVVVGHSLGGFVAPLVADRLGADHLVLCAAMIPAPGETADEWWEASGFTAAERPSYDGEIATFLHDVEPELAEEELRRARDQSASMMAEPFPLETWPEVPTSFVVFRDDRFLPAAFQRDLARRRLGIQSPAEVPGGHCAYLSHPAELAATILAVSRAAEPERAGR